MKDQPLFEVDDTTTSYSPPRTPRPRWVDRGRMDAQAQTAGGPVISQHWYEPEAVRRPSVGTRSTSGPQTAQRSPGGIAARPRAPLVMGAVAVALVSAAVASVGTVALLAAGGWLGEPGKVGGGVTAQVSQPPVRTVYVDRPDTTRIAAEVSPAVVAIVVGSAPGDPLKQLTSRPATAVIASGVVFDRRGWIITNRHVVCAAESIAVLLGDGRRLPARVYGLDSLTDLAVIHVDATDLSPADIGDSASLRPGQLSLVIGSSAEGLSSTVTSGVISALGRDLVVGDPCTDGARRVLRNVIQTDAPVRDGSTGGALVDTVGAVVGVSTTVAGDPEAAGYAIPINIAKPIMEQAIEGKPLSRPWMGITYTALTPAIAKANGLPIDHGAWLRSSTDGTLPAVVPGGPADQAGLREGDVLTAIDDQRIDSAHSLDEILSQYRPQSQDPITVSILRDGAPLERQLTLGIRTEGGT